MRCNGTTDRLEAAEHLSVTNTFTMEAWVNPTAPHELDAEPAEQYGGMQGQRYVIYPTHGTAAWGWGHAGAGFSVGTNGVSIYEHAGYYIPAVLTYETPIEGWTHVAVVYNDGTPSLFINGELVKTGVRSTQQHVHPSGGNRSEPGWITGGIGGGPYGYFEGAIDDVRIWDVARGESELRGTMNGIPAAAPGLVLNFDMNRTGEGAGLHVGNKSGASLPGVTVGTASTPVFEPVVKSGAKMEETPGLSDGGCNRSGDRVARR